MPDPSDPTDLAGPAGEAPAAGRSPGPDLPAYAELHCLSNFSFQRGASDPEELVLQAAALGYAGLAITDECSVAGVVRAWSELRDARQAQREAREANEAAARRPADAAAPRARIDTTVHDPELEHRLNGLHLMYGSEFVCAGFRLVAIAHNAEGWGNLCECITRARRSAAKGDYHVDWRRGDFAGLAHCEILLALDRSAVPDDGIDSGIETRLELAAAQGDDAVRSTVPSGPVAANDEHMHAPVAAVRQVDPSNRIDSSNHTNPDAATNPTDIPEPPSTIDSIAACPIIAWAKAQFGARLWLLAELPNASDDALWLASLRRLGAAYRVPLVAGGDVHMHARGRKPLHDVITAVRHGRTVAGCGFALHANAERHLRLRRRLALTVPADLLAHTLVVAGRCRFDLDDIRPLYQYPLENVPEGETPTQTLARLTWAGARSRYAGGLSAVVRGQIEVELALIAELGYEMFFLTVEDIVRFARERGILCQGRGSAANSAVCYCLHITAVDPARSSLLFERFLSRERREPPDIDVDFEHQRREEVIQYIYAKYGRDRAAIAAVVTCWRNRSAIRDVGKALAVPDGLIDEFAKDHYWFDDTLLADRLEQAQQRSGARAPDRLLRQWLDLTAQLTGFPRHLSQHVGGFVLTQTRLCRLVPIENASMPDRSVIQWEKNDLEAMGILKVDVLALGMLSAIRRSLELVNTWRGTHWTMASLPAKDEQTFDMICRADTVGVFQIESRAQMSMLPRLQPRAYYDLVVEVAIVRPGPIQGGMVHPYLRNREKQRRGMPIHYEKPELIPALGRTLGVPIFQEQVMQISMIAAGFTADEADRLRRSMAAWKRKGGIDRFYQPLVDGMVGNGYDPAYAERIFEQIRGFGEYGFPESHAASFALLVYVSCWLKCHEPACFLAAMLNAQPMGFYTPSQLVQDARRHGVQVLPVDVTASGWDTGLEQALAASAAAAMPAPPRHLRQQRDAAAATAAMHADQPAVRLGLRMVQGFDQASAERLLMARQAQPFANAEDLALRAGLDAVAIRALAAADALQPLAGHRRQQVWEASAHRRAPTLLRGVPTHEAALLLPAAPEGEEIVGDYTATGLTLRRHPLALLRDRLARRGIRTADDLLGLPHGQRVRACGMVALRQRPPTAKGTMFVTLEDETGTINIIVWPDMVEACREALLKSRLLAVEGIWQRSGSKDLLEDIDGVPAAPAADPDGHADRVSHLLGQRFRDLTPWLGRLAHLGRKSRDFH